MVPVFTGSIGLAGVAGVGANDFAEEAVFVGSSGFKLTKSCIEPVNCACIGAVEASAFTAGLTVQASSSVGCGCAAVFVGDGREPAT